LGDQLEHWAFCLHVAQMVNATLALMGGDAFSHSRHSGGEDYRLVADMLGIQFKYDETTAALAGPVRSMNYDKLVELYQRGETLPCNSSVRAAIRSCGGGKWCDNRPGIQTLSSVLWTMRRNHAREACHGLGLGTPRSPGVVNVLLHVRTGDICLRCKDVAYYERVVGFVQRAVASGAMLRIRFESEHRLPALRAAFPTAEFTQSSIMGAVCGFLTSDVLVTPGSSFSPYVAAFAPPWKPVVFEERRKEVGLMEQWLKLPVSRHFFTEKEAVLMEDGVPMLDASELQALLRAKVFS
jgi:hypothetical protein